MHRVRLHTLLYERPVHGISFFLDQRNYLLGANGRLCSQSLSRTLGTYSPHSLPRVRLSGRWLPNVMKGKGVTGMYLEATVNIGRYQRKEAYRQR